MVLENLLKLAITILFVASLIMLNFALFRIRIKNNYNQIIILALVVGATNFYFKFILGSPSAYLFQTIVYIIVLMSLRLYPFLYSVIVCITGSIVVSLIDAFVTIGALQLKLSTLDDMSNNLLHFVIFHVIVSMLYLICTYILISRAIGFSFIIRKFSGKKSLNNLNFIWAILLIVGTMIFQFSSLQLSVFSLHGYIILLMTVGLIAVILFAIKQNKKMIQDRYSADFVKKG